MDIIDRAGILEFHRERIDEFGAGTRESLGWLTPDGQHTRFEVLTEIGDLQGHSILDVGCGHGDLCAFVSEKFTEVDYTGIDHCEPFLEVASARHGAQPNTKFYLGDFTSGSLPEVDYVIACGALSYRSREPDFVESMITRLFASCRIGFAFSLLRVVDQRDSVLAAHDPEKIVEHCKGLKSAVKLRDDYLPEDFSVFMYRN